MGKCLLISMCETLGSQYWKLGRKKEEERGKEGKEVRTEGEGGEELKSTGL